jgi:hypothetical protein
MNSIKTQAAALDPEAEKKAAELQRKLHSLRESRAGATRVQDRDPGAQEVIGRLDRDIAAVLVQLRELRPATPTEQLAELQAEIAAAEAALRQFGDRKVAAVEAKLKREPEAAERLQEIQEQIATADGRLSTLRQRHSQLQAKIDADRAADRKRAAEATPRRLAGLHREHMALAETLTTAAATFSTAFRAIAVNNAEMCELMADQQQVRNFLSVGAFHARARNAFALAFAIDPRQPLIASNSLFGLASGAVGEQSRWTLAEWEQPGLDDLVPFFVSEADAEAAHQRLEVRGCQTIVVPVHEAFTLVPFERVFGDEASARRAAARSATPMTVIAHDGGYVLLPAHFAEAA